MIKQLQTGAPNTECYHIITHGGIGDISWIYSKLCNLSLPIFFDVASETPYRPKRVGDYLDMLPKVCGWRYGSHSFGLNGAMWTQGPQDAATAFHKTWEELQIKPNVPTKLECNKWLESGRSLASWLPDLPTSYHYSFDDAHIPTVEIRQPAVGLHFTGWPDIHDGLWVEAARLLSRKANLYLIGAPYDSRTKGLFPQLKSLNSSIIPVVGESWAVAWNTMRQLKFLLGHASGMTILANVLGIPGAVVNPAVHPKLRGTWNDPKFTRQVQIQTADQFISAAHRIAEAIVPTDSAHIISKADDENGLGKALLDAVLRADAKISYSSCHTDFFYGLGAFRSPRRLLYIGEDVDVLRKLLLGIYAQHGRRIEVVQVISTAANSEALTECVKDACRLTPFKPAIRVYKGYPDDEQARRLACQSAPFDLGIVDVGTEAPHLAYNGMSLASHVARTGGGMVLLNNITKDNNIRDQYMSFCAGRDKSPAIVKTPSGWGLLFQ